MRLAQAQISAVDTAALRRAPLVREPFPYLIVPEFVTSEAYRDIAADFPRITRDGSFPISALKCGPAFSAFCEELSTPEMRDLFASKLECDLTDRPSTITVRGQTVKKNGSIHVDSRSKLVTVLIYLNDRWSADGGRLRLLRSDRSLDDMVAEVPPYQGSMVAFVNTENAWHGHKPFVGPRRSIQLNWVVDDAAANRADRRHRFSALLKRLFPF